MKMHRNPYWLIFLTLIALVVAWYCGTALYRVYRYSRLTAQAPASHFHWGTQALSDNQYIIDATYEYTVDGINYPGETRFKDDIFMNNWAAEQSIPKYAYRKWNAWYQPGNFSHSTLQKTFPSKECYSAGAMLVLLLYFVGLGFYVTRTKA